MASEYMDNQVRRLAGSMSDVDWREMDEKNDRWSGFSDEELRDLRACILAPHDGPKMSLMATELRMEVQRREAERSSYRGPGRYRGESGNEYEVIGWGVDGGTGRRMILYRMPISMTDGQLNGHWGIPADHFEGGYEYLGPLERDVVPTEIKLVDAGEDWAVLETFDRNRFRLVKGDTFTVPTLVIS